MSRSWLFAVAAVFVATFAAVVFLVNRANSNARAAPASEAPVEACEGCGVDQATARFGWGRIVGETVTLPEGERDIARPVVAVTFRDDFAFCLVPVATATLAAAAQTSATCAASTPLDLVLITSREPDVTAAQHLGETIAAAGLTNLSVRVATDPVAWRSILATDISPAALVLNGDSTVVGAWVGFDPGHGPDLITAIHQATGCTGTPAAAKAPPVRSALATTTAGDRVPDWIMQELGLTPSDLPATLIFSDDNCPLCMEIKDQLLGTVIPQLAQDTTVIYIDSTPSTEFLEQRTNHMLALADSPLSRAINQAFPDLTMMAAQYATSQPEPPANSNSINTHPDPKRQLATSLVGGTVPAAITMNSNAAIHTRLTYSAGETNNQYLQRLSTASAAAASQP